MSFPKFENVLLLILLVLAAACFLIGWPLNRADAHEAAAGWDYPFACCSGYDCRMVGDQWSEAPVKVFETAEGYRISTTGEIVPQGDTRLKQSPDGDFHWCSVAGKNDGRTICLFAPPRSF